MVTDVLQVDGYRRGESVLAIHIGSVSVRFLRWRRDAEPVWGRRLKELAAAFSCWSYYPLLIEATPEHPQLAAARRNHVSQLLHDNGVPARVEVGVPTGFMPTGEEALLMNQNLLRQVRKWLVRGNRCLSPFSPACSVISLPIRKPHPGRWIFVLRSWWGRVGLGTTFG